MIHKYIKRLVITITVALCLILPHSSFAGDLGSDFMIDLWKYRTGEANTGLLTGRPSQNLPEAPPVITVNVTGTIDCLQALPLNPNDVIEVQLLDFSSRSSAAVIAYQQITAARNIPIPFKLTYNPASINPVHHYTVQARIMRNGEPAYCNTSPAFVVTHGYAGNIRVLVSAAGGERAARADYDSMVSPSHADSRVYIGTYTRSFTGAGGTVEETLRVLSDHTMELYARYAKGAVKQSGVWSMEINLLAVTVTHKNGEPVNPERIVFELKGDCLAAVEYDRAAHGPHFSFNRTGGQK
jgi:putative lipoprotein